MTDKDAAIGRKLMVDELNTVNEYEAMAEHASPDVAKVVRDVADEEKVHAGEGAAIVDANDPRARPAMEEGVKEARKIMKFEDMLKKAIDDKDGEKGYPPLSEDKLMRDPYRHVKLQANDQVNMNGNDGEHISTEGSVETADKNDGQSGAYDEENPAPEKKVETDGVSGSYDEGQANHPERDVPDDGVSGTYAKAEVPSFADMYIDKGGFVKKSTLRD